MDARIQVTARTSTQIHGYTRARQPSIQTNNFNHKYYGIRSFALFDSIRTRSVAQLAVSSVFISIVPFAQFVVVILCRHDAVHCASTSKTSECLFCWKQQHAREYFTNISALTFTRAAHANSYVGCSGKQSVRTVCVRFLLFHRAIVEHTRVSVSVVVHQLLSARRINMRYDFGSCHSNLFAFGCMFEFSFFCNCITIRIIWPTQRQSK